VILVGKASGAIALTLTPSGAHCHVHNCAFAGGIGECRRTLVYQLYLDQGAAIVTYWTGGSGPKDAYFGCSSF
jgi:hypothetical protein